MFIRKCQWVSVLVLLLIPDTVKACAVCFGAAESKLVHGSVVGGIVLMGITVLVLSAFGYFIFYLRKKSNRFNKIKMNGKYYS